jgi:hypothetical protein
MIGTYPMIYHTIGAVLEKKSKMKIVIEIPNDVTQKDIEIIKELIDETTVDDIIGVLNGEEVQWVSSKKDGNIPITIKEYYN